MVICKICGSSNFDLLNGLYYCTECNTQTEDTRDEVSDIEGSLGGRNIRTRKTSKRKKKSLKLYAPWISTEAYNILLCKQVNSLIELGASKKLKDAVLYIWALYLQKIQVAFRNDFAVSRYAGPCLGPFSMHRDKDVLFNKRIPTIKHRKYRLKRRKQDLEADNFKKAKKTNIISEENELLDCNTVSKKSRKEPKIPNYAYSLIAKRLWAKYKKKPLKTAYKQGNICYMTMKKTLAFSYLGLLYVEDQIMLSDLIRFAKEGKIPYFNATGSLPSWMHLSQSDHKFLDVIDKPSITEILSYSTRIIRFLQLPKIRNPSLLKLVARFVKNFNLPNAIIPFANTLLSKLNIALWFDGKKPFYLIPSYESQAMAIIIIILKIIFLLDGKSENLHSDITRKINSSDKNIHLFVWDDWMQNMKLKESILKYNEDISFLNGADTLDIDQIRYRRHSKANSYVNYPLGAKLRKVRNEMKTLFSANISLASCSLPKTSSFPLRSQAQNFVSFAQKSHLYKNSNCINLEFLLTDFSTYSIEYLSPPENINLSEELLNLFDQLKLFYQPSHAENIDTISKEENSNVNSKYWFIYKTKFSKKLPSSFRWLLMFLSKSIEIDYSIVYNHCATFEKNLFFTNKI